MANLNCTDYLHACICTGAGGDTESCRVVGTEFPPFDPLNDTTDAAPTPAADTTIPPPSAEHLNLTAQHNKDTQAGPSAAHGTSDDLPDTTKVNTGPTTVISDTTPVDTEGAEQASEDTSPNISTHIAASENTNAHSCDFELSSAEGDIRDIAEDERIDAHHGNENLSIVGNPLLTDNSDNPTKKPADNISVLDKDNSAHYVLLEPEATPEPTPSCTPQPERQLPPPSEYAKVRQLCTVYLNIRDSFTAHRALLVGIRHRRESTMWSHSYRHRTF